MAALTTRLVLAKHGATERWYQAGIGTIKPGYCVMYDDADEVTLATASAAILGVAGLKRGHDINTVYTSGEMIPVWLVGSGVELYVLFDDGTNNATITRGDIAVTSATDSGCVGEDSTSPTYETVVGRFIETITITGNVPTFIAIKLI